MMQKDLVALFDNFMTRDSNSAQADIAQYIFGLQMVETLCDVAFARAVHAHAHAHKHTQSVVCSISVRSFNFTTSHGHFLVCF